MNTQTFISYDQENDAAAACEISPCQKYRFTLWRRWNDHAPTVMFIGLNPSTADAVKNDATIRRCIGFAKYWGMGSLVMTNLFAFRATMPADMKRHPNPVGSENDKWLMELAPRAELIIAAWGTHGRLRDRDRIVSAMLSGRNLQCLGYTNGLDPRHPLRLPKRLHPIPFQCR